MRRLLNSLFDIRKGEYLVTVLMVFYYYLLLVTYYLLKPARDSLFLVKLGATQLPFVFIMIAIVVVPITTLYGRASRAFKPNQLLSVTVALIIATILLLRWLLTLEQDWIFYLFYIYVSIYGILTTSQFWLVANAVFDPSQAKRIFALIGLGGILGASTGGEVTGFIITHFDVATEDLLFICIGFLLICLVLGNVIWRLKRREDGFPSRAARYNPARKHKQQSASYIDMFRMISGSRLLLAIVGIIAMTMATASFVDYQFKAVSAAAFPETAGLTAFLGTFYGRLSLVSLLIQLLLTNRLVRLLGVGGAILFLPLGLLVSSGLMLFMPGLFAAVMLRGTDGCFKYSIDKTGRELLFLPVPQEIKNRTKLFVDMFVDRWFRGFAGALLLLFTLVLHFSVRQLSIVVLVFLAIWLSVALLVRKEYVNAFRLALERRSINLDDVRININEASTIKALSKALAGGNQRQILYALDMLQSVSNDALVENVTPLLRNESREVRLKAIALLDNQKKADVSPEVGALLDDGDPEVRLAAMRYLCGHAEGDAGELLNGYIKSADPYLRAAAVVCMVEIGEMEDRFPVDTGIIDELLSVEGEAGEVCRTYVARALGYPGAGGMRSYLFRLLDDFSPAVVREAIHSIGLRRDRRLVPELLNKLADKRYRAQAREALSSYGNAILGTLHDYLGDTTIPFHVRAGIPRIVAGIQTQEALEMLAGNLDHTDSDLRFLVVKALNKMRSMNPELVVKREVIHQSFLEETRTYYEILQVLYLHERGRQSPAGMLLSRALEEKLDHNLEHIFRLLALTHGPSDMYSAYLGVVSDKKALRASAIEFLDNLLAKDVKKYLFPIIDRVSVEALISKGRSLFGIGFNNVTEALEYLVAGTDAWLRACAIYNADLAPSDRLRELVGQAASDGDFIVRETAQLMKKRLEME